MILPRRQFLTGSATLLAGLTLGNTPVRPITLEPGGRLTQGGWLRGRLAPGASALTLDGKPVPFAPDGAFLVAFDRDAGTSAHLVASFANGKPAAETLTIAPRAWNIEHINVARKPGGVTDEAYMRLRKAELARIGAARSLDTGAQGWRQNFVRPAPGRLSGRFGSQRIYKGEPAAYHSGLDIAGGAGTVYVAPADGVVILAAADKAFSLEGHLLMLDHGMGLNSAFLHGSSLLVKEGDSVKRGDPLGRIGATGRATGPHLHWSIKWGGSRLDPLLLLNPAA
ncbi:MAG: peptidase [Novosphingobium sp. 16-62-11]|uniref:M23 family metallopeptidase n=1 Tax=Novosphingobium sp. 17-62-19 TaxID=1970406 RepID=UPI000BD13FD7|nr:M23 family metallopeptidase [Novosphingobium sp. 17-62-19]OYX95470.1 MAG: peptidase [Novosphingobium sp. 35-62-5]OYZ43844.1 MAG: peptidase [Novosphingobium sp. 16-62-11]OZA21079.1 MAG: peptidase [Novosphingobium sp. 17-62-19]HQS95621.1 M23 family metallopeptidase [Novosphingobium sp.]